MRITIDDDDLKYAAERSIRTVLEDFVWDSWTHSALGANRFKQEGIFSVAVESAVAKRLGYPRKAIDDTGPDLPGVEVASCSTDHWEGRPYFVSRKTNPRDPSTRYFLPTLTSFRVPTRDRVVELRFFIEPHMLPKLRLYHRFPKDSGITRWLVVPETAQALDADVNVWARLEQAVRAAGFAVPSSFTVPNVTTTQSATAASLTQAILSKQ